MTTAAVRRQALDPLRVARRKVIERGWHRKPGVGGMLRKLGRYTP
jgi:hypothetical protein